MQFYFDYKSTANYVDVRPIKYSMGPFNVAITRILVVGGELPV